MMTTLNLLAAGWTWPAVAICTVFIVCFTLIATAAVSSRNYSGAAAGIGPRRLDTIDEELAAIRADLAELKDSIAELDRVLKSVG